MPSAVVILERSSAIPKDRWRSATQSRTWPSLDVRHIFTQLWQQHQAHLPASSYLSLALDADGALPTVTAPNPLAGARRAQVGVFDIAFVAPDEVEVTLLEMACRQKLGTPPRATRQIALLRPWQVIRVLLNGRHSSYSGQTYYLREYHLALCTEPLPTALVALREIDLQAGLA